MRKMILSSLSLVSGLVLADGLSGIYFCQSSMVDNSQKPAIVSPQPDSFFSFSTNGTAIIFAPLAVGPYITMPGGYAMIAPSNVAGSYRGLSGTMGLVTATQAADGNIKASIVELGLPDASYELACKKVW